MLWLNIDLASCHSRLSCRPRSVAISLLYPVSLSLSLSDSFPQIWLYGFHLHFLSPSFVTFLVPVLPLPPSSSSLQLFLAITGSDNSNLCNNVCCCFRDAVPARGGGLPGPGHGDEEPVHRQRHAHPATRGRPRQQVRTHASQSSSTRKLYFIVDS